jgi:RimJ/RimL family protein N-acetyltransferase
MACRNTTRAEAQATTACHRGAGTYACRAMAAILETERLLLRELTEADADDLIALNANPNVRRFVGEGPLADHKAALEVLRGRIFPQYRDHGVGRWAVILRDGGAFIGWCGLKALPETKEYDLGYRLLEEHWGKGLATEASAAVLAWARERLPGARIIAKALAGNGRSIRVMQKLGLRFERREEDPNWGPTEVYVVPGAPPAV